MSTSTVLSTTNLNTLIAKPCPYTFLEGPHIGQRCGQPSNGYRCIAHAGKKWPEKSYICQRMMTKGPRKDQPCGKSTKFQDGVCCTCRKIKK